MKIRSKIFLNIISIIKCFKFYKNNKKIYLYEKYDTEYENNNEDDEKTMRQNMIYKDT